MNYFRLGVLIFLVFINYTLLAQNRAEQTTIRSIPATITNDSSSERGDITSNLKKRKIEPFYYFSFLTGGIGLSKFQEYKNNRLISPSMTFGIQLTYLPVFDSRVGLTFKLSYDVVSGILTQEDSLKNRLHYFNAGLSMTGKMGDLYLSGGLYGAYLFNHRFSSEYSSVSTSSFDFGFTTDLKVIFRLSETMDLHFGLELKVGLKKAFTINGKDFSNFSALLHLGFGFSNGHELENNRNFNRVISQKNQDILNQRIWQKVEMEFKQISTEQTIAFYAQDTTLASEFIFQGQELDYEEIHHVFKILGSSGLENFENAWSDYRKVKAALVFTCIIHPVIVVALTAHRMNARLLSSEAANLMMIALNTSGDLRNLLLKKLLYAVEKKRLEEFEKNREKYTFFGAKIGGGFNMNFDKKMNHLQFGFRYMYLVPFHGHSLFKGGFTIDVLIDSKKWNDEMVVPSVGVSFLGTVKIKSLYINNGVNISFKIDKSTSSNEYFKKIEFAYIGEFGLALGDTFKCIIGLTMIITFRSVTETRSEWRYYPSTYLHYYDVKLLPFSLLFHISFGY